MTSRIQSLRQSMPETITNVTSIFCMVMGVVVLGGWLLDISLLKSISPEWGTMKANAAAGFILAGASLWILREENIPKPSRFLAAGFAVVITLVGVLTLAEYVFRKNFGIDQLLFEEVLGAGDLSPGRMAPASATCFVLIGLALLGLDWKNQRGRRLTQTLPLAVAVVSLFSVIGYLYEAKPLYYVFSYISPMALHTAVLFFGLSLGVLSVRFERSPISPLIGAGVGSRMARWLLPIAFGIPVFLGWLWLKGEQAGLYGSEVGATLLTTSLVVILVAFVWRMTSSLNREETERSAVRKQAEEALLKAGSLQSAIFNSANFSSIATDAKGVIQIFNVGAERMLGYTAAEVMNKISPADISDPQELIARAKALSVELGTPITSGFEALVFKASRGIEDIYELTYIRKDGSRFPATVSVTALREVDNQIIGYLLIGTDNTARQQADEKVRSAAQYARSLIEASLDPLVTISAEGKITDVNAGSVQVTGVPREKLIGTDFSDYFTEPDRAREGYREAFSKGSVTDYPLTIRHKDTSLTDVLYNASVYKDVQGNVLGVFAAARDITARKQAEAALLEAGALQRAIFNSANFSSIATDAKGVIQIFNVGAEHMLGYTAAEVMNKITPADISDPQEVIARAKALSAELGTPITPGFEALVFKASRGIEDIYELTYIRKDGSRFPAVVSVTALRDADSQIIGYLLIGTDNTARKQVEAEQRLLDQRLRDQQFYTRSLIESNIDALMTTDPSGIITDVNKQMEALTGCTRDELIGAPFKNYFTDPDRAEAGIKLVLSEKKVTDYELTARARDNKQTVVSYNAATFYDRDRKLQGVFAAARDITERKLLDQVLQEKNLELESAKSVAEKANLAKSDFLSSMSHELRTPLNAILGFAQLLETDVPPPKPAQKESITQILQAGWHLLELINEILDLAKVESGTVPLSLEPVSLAEVMLECQAMIEQQAQKREIQLIFPRVEISHFVRADRTRLKQILINLLSNAIKYNTKQGTIEVECAEITPGHIRVSIRDTGEGLTEEQMMQLFQPFNRLGQEAGGEEGTGIGLVVAKRLVELMGGTIHVESTVGVGSVFGVELIAVADPGLAAEESDVEPMARLRAPPGVRPYTLLYVEDNPANMKLVETIIARHPDIRLLTAVNGDLGIKIARDTLPDIILMDINLPGISGFDALKILRSDPATTHIPVIAISANAMRLDIKRGLEAGFFRYITKPVKVNELLEALDVALEFGR